MEDVDDEKQDASYFNFGGFSHDDMHPSLDRNGSVPNTKSIKVSFFNEFAIKFKCPWLFQDYKKNTRKRIVSKTGQSNTQLFRVNKKKTRLLKDVFVTILDWKWRYTLLAFITSFMLSWLIFAVFW